MIRPPEPGRAGRSRAQRGSWTSTRRSCTSRERAAPACRRRRLAPGSAIERDRETSRYLRPRRDPLRLVPVPLRAAARVPRRRREADRRRREDRALLERRDRSERDRRTSRRITTRRGRATQEAPARRARQGARRARRSPRSTCPTSRVRTSADVPPGTALEPTEDENAKLPRAQDRWNVINDLEEARAALRAARSRRARC